MKSRQDQPARSTMSGSRAEIIFYGAAALISLLGLAEATYLTVIFVLGETAVCGGSADCFQVLGSGYAKIGPVPVSGLGAVAYFGACSFATFAGFAFARERQCFTLSVLGMFCFTHWLLCFRAFRMH